jgi:predicted HTH transcriptional regulator
MKRSDIDRIVKAIEASLNAEIPGTPRITGRVGGRVMYVALPGKGKNRDALSRRAGQVLTAIARKKEATSKALQGVLQVNRNVIAGAIHELKQAKLVKAVTMPEPALAQSVAEHRPRTSERKARTPRLAATAADRARRK